MRVVVCDDQVLLREGLARLLTEAGMEVVYIGLLLFYQNTFNHFESWAYAWALIPFAVGIGLVINGTWSEQPARRQTRSSVSRTHFSNVRGEGFPPPVLPVKSDMSKPPT